jgi:uncharacterized protein with ParB-like and HNH nuclease domain
MGLKPYDRLVKDVFNGIQYDIDFYQRDYRWSDELEWKPVSSLLKDIFYRFDLEKYNPNQEVTQESISKLEWYYLNSFMTNTTNGKTYIVDGQQRLTTLTLISIALLHLAIKFELESHITDTLKQSILGSNEFGTTYWMGFKDRKDTLADLLKNNLDCKLRPKNISQKNIYQNYKLIFEKISSKLTSAHKLHTFITYYRTRIFLIEINVDKNKDVAMVFEVINDRGIPLQPYEILKGKLLSQIDIEDRERYIDIWENEVNKLLEYNEYEPDEFFSYYFRSKYANSAEEYRKLDPSRYHKVIFLKDFNKKIKLHNNEKLTRNFIENELPFFVKIYLKICNYYDDYDKNFEHVYFNRLNDMDGQFLLILSAISFNDKQFEKKIQEVSRGFDKLFVLLRLTGSYKSNEFNNSIISINPKLRDIELKNIQKIFDDELLSFVKKSQARNELKKPFRYEFFKPIGYTYYGKTFWRYFFARIDHFISENSNLNEYGTYYQLVLQSKGKDVYHIEHIISNNEANIKQFNNEDEFNEQRNRLGALLLLKGKDNKSSGNEEFKDKLKTYNVLGTYYAKSLLKDMYHKKVEFLEFIKNFNLSFRSYSSYARPEIEERQRLLFKIVKHIWDA